MCARERIRENMVDRKGLVVVESWRAPGLISSVSVNTHTHTHCLCVVCVFACQARSVCMYLVLYRFILKVLHSWSEESVEVLPYNLMTIKYV